MSIFLDLINYRVEVDWLLMWFPLMSTSALRETKTRGGRFTYSITDLPQTTPGGTWDNHILGKGNAHFGDHSDPLGYGQQTVDAQIGMAVNERQTFIAELTVTLGSKQRTIAGLVLPPDTRTPFMVNVRASEEEDDPGIKDTALVLQGVFATDLRDSSRLAEFMTSFATAAH